MKIILTRHGISTHNLEAQGKQAFVGRAQSSVLTTDGARQALALAQRLKREERIGVIFSSSLPRATETAWIIARELGIEKIKEELAFIEMEKGQWVGQKWSKILTKKTVKQWNDDPLGFRPPGGESWGDVADRAWPAFRNLMRYQKDVLLVAHSNVLRMILFRILGFDLRKAYDIKFNCCSITELEVIDGRIFVRRLNDHAHLQNDEEID